MMLEPDYFLGKEDRLIEIFRKLEDDILHDITRRLVNAGELTATADRLLYRLQQMGESREYIEQKLAEYMDMSRAELRKVLQNAILASWASDEETLKQMGLVVSPPLENALVIQIMDAEYKKTLGELSNLTRTTMDQAQKDLINLMDEAEMRVAAGAESYTQATADVLDRYAGRGVMVTYPTGTKRTLEAAVRCCVVTSMNQTAAQVTNQYIVETKSEYVLISAHTGARPQKEGQPYCAGHENWQGKVHRIRGSEPGYPNLLESTGYDIDPVTGQGKVVNPLGLHGYNCRHSHQMWDKDLRNPYLDENGNLKISTEENRKKYDLMQEQRKMERSIRATKRRLLTMQTELNMLPDGTPEKTATQNKYDALSYKLTRQNKAYNDFCDRNNMAPQYERNKVAGYGYDQERRSKTGAKRYKQKAVYNS